MPHPSPPYSREPAVKGHILDLYLLGRQRCRQKVSHRILSGEYPSCGAQAAPAGWQETMWRRSAGYGVPNSTLGRLVLDKSFELSPLFSKISTLCMYVSQNLRICRERLCRVELHLQGGKERSGGGAGGVQCRQRGPGVLQGWLPVQAQPLLHRRGGGEVAPGAAQRAPGAR